MMMMSDKSPTYAELRDALRLVEVPVFVHHGNTAEWWRQYRKDKREGARPLTGARGSRSKYDG
jgi:hypothetical protein